MKTYTNEEVIKLVSQFFYEGMTFEQFFVRHNFPELWLRKKIKEVGL